MTGSVIIPTVRGIYIPYGEGIIVPGTSPTIRGLGEFELLVLYAVLRLGDDAYGVTVRREIEGRTGREVSQGAVYTALERLQTRGLLGSTLGDPTPERGGKRKRFYRLEPAGAAALERSRNALQRMAAGQTRKLARLLDG